MVIARPRRRAPCAAARPPKPPPMITTCGVRSVMASTFLSRFDLVATQSARSGDLPTTLSPDRPHKTSVEVCTSSQRRRRAPSPHAAAGAAPGRSDRSGRGALTGIAYGTASARLDAARVGRPRVLVERDADHRRRVHRHVRARRAGGRRSPPRLARGHGAARARWRSSSACRASAVLGS